jgi:hypothetical protein
MFSVDLEPAAERIWSALRRLAHVARAGTTTNAAGIVSVMQDTKKVVSSTEFSGR